MSKLDITKEDSNTWHN